MAALRDALRDLPDPVFADLLESDDAYLLVIDLPGATSDTIDVQARAGRIAIEARREKDVPMEFDYTRENRPVFLDIELPLPPDATGTDASASFDRGVLELRLPKRSATSEHTIPIEDA